MATRGGTSLYQQVVDISKDYLGPAGERFIRRQIITHLGIEPENLRKQDMKKLVDWTQLTFALLTDDAGHVETFSKRLSLLARPAVRKT